jgi:Trypsin-like peptidase domain
MDAQGHIATAGHVVSSLQALKLATNSLLAKGSHVTPETFKQDIKISFPAPSTRSGNSQMDIYNVDDSFTATIVAEDDTIDLAIVKCDRNPVGLSSGMIINGKPLREAAKVPKLHMDLPRDGEMISVSGFPLSIPVLATNSGWIASSYFKDERHRSVYLGSILVNHGNSGGPAYLVSDGSILGVVTEYWPAPEGNSGLTMIIPMQSVFAVLASAK